MTSIDGAERVTASRGLWARFIGWLRPSAEAALRNQQARERADRGTADGTVEHGRHHGGGHHGQFPVGGL